MRQREITVFAAFALVFLSSLASADGIDAVAYFSRTPAESLALAIPLVMVFMVANYGLNYLVIGLPARHFGSSSLRAILVPLIWLTLLGQVADRIGAIIAGYLTDPVTEVLGFKGEAAPFMSLFLLNFVFSAMSVGALALVFTKRVWGLSWRQSLLISSGAGILTNPLVVLAGFGLLQALFWGFYGQK